MAKTICQCANPPGGNMSCADNQFAICRVINGECKGECVNLPEKVGEFKSANQYAQFLNRLVYEITGEVRFNENLDIIEALDILRAGSYKNPYTGEVVTFNFPDGIDFS